MQNSPFIPGVTEDLKLVQARVRALAVEAWVARKVATMTRGLDQFAVARVDERIAGCIDTESPGRVLTICQAAIIAADPAAHAAKLEAERRRRFVSLSQTDEHGLRHLIARIEAGDAVWIDATVNRVADILATRPDLRPGTPAEITKDELRALALGWLARPADLLDLLNQPHRRDHDGDHGVEHDVDPGRRRPTVVLYVHLHEAALQGVGGVARCEGLGPALVDQVKTWLGHARVTLKPVIDLADRVSVNAYEHPEPLKERVHLQTPGDVFPHATTLGRHLDLDHTVPYQPGGPPGQTSTDNTSPLARTTHRVKTHAAGYRVRQTGPGEYVWRTPHHRYRLVDHTGTHLIDADVGSGLLSDDPVDQALARLLHQHRTGQLESVEG